MLNGECFDDDLTCRHSKNPEPYEVFRLAVIMMHGPLSARFILATTLKKCDVFRTAATFFQIGNWKQRWMFRVLVESGGVYVVFSILEWSEDTEEDP